MVGPRAEPPSPPPPHSGTPSLSFHFSVLPFSCARLGFHRRAAAGGGAPPGEGARLPLERATSLAASPDEGGGWRRTPSPGEGARLPLTAHDIPGSGRRRGRAAAGGGGPLVRGRDCTLRARSSGPRCGCAASAIPDPNTSSPGRRQRLSPTTTQGEASSSSSSLVQRRVPPPFLCLGCL
jgi:hypothetical protein